MGRRNTVEGNRFQKMKLHENRNIIVYHSSEMAGEGEDARRRDAGKVVGSKVGKGADLLPAAATNNTWYVYTPSKYIYIYTEN
jgi:hypothetical protein